MKTSKPSSFAHIPPLAAAGSLPRCGNFRERYFHAALLLATSLCLAAGARAASEAYTLLAAYSSAADQTGTLYNYSDYRETRDPHFQVYDHQTRPDVSEVVTANFGYLNAKMTNAAVGVSPSGGHFGSGDLRATWSDMVTISHSTLNGTPGVFRVRFSVSGYLSADRSGPVDSGLGAAISMNASFNEYAVPGVSLNVNPSNPSQSQFINFTAADFTGNAAANYLDIPFTFGKPFSLSAQLWLDNPAAGGYGSAKVDGSVTMLYRGGGVYDSNMKLVSNYVANSDSGTNWVVSQEFYPDAKIRAGTTGAFVGDGIYNATGSSQGITKSAAIGNTVTFGISVQNDGTVDDSFNVKATGSAASNYAVSYYDGTTDITSKVVAGTYTTPLLGRGKSYLITAKVYVNPTAVAGSRISRLVTAKSTKSTSRVDAVKLTVNCPG